MLVKQIFKQKDDRIVTVQPSDTVATATEVLKRENIGALMVSASDGDLAGILSERDIVRRMADTPGQTLPQSVSDLMTSDVQTCRPDEALTDILKRMSEGRFRHLPVIDESGLCGMITIGDVVNFRLNELEYEALKMKQMIVG